MVTPPSPSPRTPLPLLKAQTPNKGTPSAWKRLPPSRPHPSLRTSLPIHLKVSNRTATSSSLKALPVILEVCRGGLAPRPTPATPLPPDLPPHSPEGFQPYCNVQQGADQKPVFARNGKRVQEKEL